MEMETHPNPQPSLHHRKIDLQSLDDLIYLQTNLAQSALEKLDLHFPKLSRPATHISLDGGASSHTPDTNAEYKQDDEQEEEDPIRLHVRTLLSAFLTTTWTSANQNITVNGLDASTIPNPIPQNATLNPPTPQTQPSSSSSRTTNPTNGDPTPPAPITQPQELEGIHFKYAPYDPTLQHKLASLHADLESLTAQVSKLRRTAPQRGATAYETALTEALDHDDAIFQHDSNNSITQEEGSEEEMQGLDIQDVETGWNQDVREVYTLGVDELASLAGVSGSREVGSLALHRPTLTETVGKAQRARKVVMEME